MSFQESKLFDELQELEHGGALHRLAMLHLNPTTNTASPTTTTTTADATKKTRGHKFEKCSQCGTIKRRSPLSSSKNATNNAAADGGGSHQSLQDATIKQLPPPNVAATTFDVITSPLPPPSSNTNLQQPLQRSLSEPIHFDQTQNAEASKAQEIFSLASVGQFFNPLSPENSKTDGTSSPSPSQAVASLPPLPPPLFRTMSGPPAADPQGLLVATITPPPPQAPRSVKRSPVSEESPDSKSKRLKRIKARMKEMSQWWGQVMHEEDEEDFSCEENNIPIDPKDGSENDHEEAVWVEKEGEGLVIHFKCPCGKGYGIFLVGNNCYYKLM